MIPLAQPAHVIEQNGNTGVFEINGLYPGYGVTVGNTIRRVLLSSLEGAAITKVNIKGAEHEFSTIEGVMEDVVAILLNLKQVRFKLYSHEPQIATLKVKGERVVTAADFKTPSQVELASKDVHIAQLTDKSAELEIEVHIEKGIGYVPKEEHTKEKQEIGALFIDAIFTPIKRVSTTVEDMRVGDRTDFNRVHIKIETDGTITPEQAFVQANEIVLQQFESIVSNVKMNMSESSAGEQEPEKRPKKKAVKKK
jgi:DNA-directed RNA polymerase subunit alpha